VEAPVSATARSSLARCFRSHGVDSRASYVGKTMQRSSHEFFSIFLHAVVARTIVIS
jgi:hypothetical protein